MAEGLAAPPLPRLMLVTDEGAEDPVGPLVRALREVEAQRVLVQVRLRHWALDARRRAALALAETGAVTVINEDTALASVLDLGVHLPERAPGAPSVRAALSPHALVGRSCHDHAGLARAADEGASYVTLGPVGPVPGKGTGHGVAWLTALAQETRLPVFALGGVTALDIPPLRRGGVHGVALMRALAASDDPVAMLVSLLAAVHAD